MIILKKYFKLHPYVKLVKGKKECALYDTLQGRLYSITLAQYDILNKCTQNLEVNVLANEDRDFLNNLLDKNLGLYYKYKNYIDPRFYGTPHALTDLLKRTTLKRLFIEITNQCNLNCCFCKTDSNLFRKTGCKRWECGSKMLSLEQWKSIIDSAKKLNCRQFIIMGGEPFLELEKLKSIVKYINFDGLSSITIFTNGVLLNNLQIIKFIKENNINLCIQILSNNDTTYNKITGCNFAYKNIRDSIELIKREGIKYGLILLVSRFNEDEVEKICTDFKDSNLRLEFIYPIKNNFYSNRFINQIYDRSKNFLKPTLEIFDNNSQYNNCYKGTLAISCDGTAYPCIMSRKLPLGNVIQIKLHEILNSELYKKYSNLNKGEIKGCKDCSKRYSCLDCRALEMSATGDIHGMKFCNLIEGY